MPVAVLPRTPNKIFADNTWECSNGLHSEMLSSQLWLSAVVRRVLLGALGTPTC